MYKFFCFKIEIKTKADSYMPYKAMAHSTKSHISYMFCRPGYGPPRA
jgi:hypothetical protein